MPVKFRIDASEIADFAKTLNRQNIAAALKAATIELGGLGERLFGRTVATWSRKPKAQIKITTTNAIARLTLRSNSQIWNWIDQGTGKYGKRRAPYPIYPKRAKALRFHAGYTPRTKPGSLDSGAAISHPPVVMRKSVMHPGIKPRKFSEQILAQLDRLAPPIYYRNLKKWFRLQKRGIRARD